MLTLAIGDLFIPERSIDIPQKFKRLLAPNPQSIPTNSKINRVICLGNILNSTSTLQFLNTISPKLELVKGEYDDASILSQQLSLVTGSHSKSTTSGNSGVNIPMYSRFVHDNLKIGYTNGYQIVPRGDPLALSAFARELDVDVLIWGGTHRVEAYTLDGKFFVNPGSATGAFSFDWPEFEEEEQEEEEAEKEGGDQDEVTEAKSAEEKAPDNAEKDSGHNEETNKTTETKHSTKEEEVAGSGNDSKEKKDTPNDLEAFKKSLYEATELNTNIPSFCILDTKGSTCILYIYTYFNNEVKVDKVTYNKE